ncbi:hypothetical protein U0070_023294, partial [Myodes glareolus]
GLSDVPEVSVVLSLVFPLIYGVTVLANLDMTALIQHPPLLCSVSLAPRRILTILRKNANSSPGSGHTGIEKKQSLMSEEITGQFFGIAESNGRPYWAGPMPYI